ncbi:hypothetical protein BGZ65_007684, partial [Modicella reniformis]
MTYPSRIWGFIARIFPWKFTRSHGQSGRVRSVEDTRHQRKTSASTAQSTPHSSEHIRPSGSKSRATPTSFPHGYHKKTGIIDTDAVSAGSGSESKARPRTKAARRSKVIEDTLQRDQPSREPVVTRAPQNQPSPGNSVSASEPTTPTTPLEASTVVTTSILRNNSLPAIGVSSSTVYETVDDGDFIPTDRRRRKKAKGHRLNSAAASSESLIKPSTTSTAQDQEPPVSHVTSASSCTSISPAPDSSETSVLLATPAPSDKPAKETTAVQTKQHSARGHKKAHSSSQCSDKAQNSLPLPRPPSSMTTATNVLVKDKETVSLPPPPPSMTTATNVLVKDKATVSLPPPRSMTTATKDKETVSLPPPRPDNALVHPIHALNTSSPIARLKPSHKRSQSAQLPPTSPWNIPPPPPSAPSSSSSSSLSTTSSSGKANPGASLSKPARSDAFTSPTGSSSETINSSNSSKETTTPVSTSSVDQPGTSSNQKTKDHDLLARPSSSSSSSSSIWYSPFQSGLDISIENDHDNEKHGSRPLSKPRIQIDASIAQQRSGDGPLLTPSSFFESSPRAPRIMPFSQHNNSGNSLGLEWAMQNNGSSSSSTAAAAAATCGTRPSLLESSSDSLLLNPMAYFNRSRSASSSRRGSIESNLTESLLSGRARMFAPSSSDPSTTTHPHQVSQQRSSNSSEGIINESSSSLADTSSFLAPHFSGGGSLTRAVSATPPLPFVSSGSPALGQAPSLETSSSSSVGSGSFRNPWEPTFSYQAAHAVSDTFTPFGPSSTMTNAMDNNNNHNGINNNNNAVDQDRQYIFHSLMNGGGGGGGGGNRVDGTGTLFGTRELD